MTTSFRLPDLGEGVHEAEILAIPVAVGQSVREGDLILEIETDKAAVEIPSPSTGTVSEILVKVGDMAVVGDVLMIFSTDTAQDAVSPPAQAVRQKLQENAAGPDRGRKRRPVPASPSTRRLARELAVDLHDVTPTGSGGIVTQRGCSGPCRTAKSISEAPTAAPETAGAEPAESAKPAAPGRYNPARLHQMGRYRAAAFSFHQKGDGQPDDQFLDPDPPCPLPGRCRYHQTRGLPAKT